VLAGISGEKRGRLKFPAAYKSKPAHNLSSISFCHYQYMAKPTSPINRGLKLKAAIKQCEATLADKTDSLQRNCASVRKDLSSLRREFNKHKESKDLPKLRKLAEKRDLLRLKVNALETEVEEFRAQQTKQINLLDEAIHEQHERMHGLLAYAAATGGLSTDAELLFNTLGDVLEAKTEGDRASAQRAVGLILQHGNAFATRRRRPTTIASSRNSKPSLTQRSRAASTLNTKMRSWPQLRPARTTPNPSFNYLSL
jgi:hypothetical protein